MSGDESEGKRPRRWSGDRVLFLCTVAAVVTAVGLWGGGGVLHGVHGRVAAPRCAKGASSIRTHAPVGSCYQASLSEGQRRIDDLARSAPLEDAWIYLEAESLWIDVGADERPTSIRIDFTPAASRLAARAATNGTRVFLYHIHPRRVLAPGRIYPPAANDIYAEVNLKRALRDHYHYMLVARVLDGSGIWTYDATEALERSLRLPDYSQDTPRWISYNEARPHQSPRELMNERYSDFLVDFIALLEPVTKDRSLSRDGKIAAYLRKARAIGIHATYRELSGS